MENVIAPTLVLAGEADYGISTESIRNQYIHTIPGAQFQIIPGATHFMIDNATGAFPQIVKKFLTE